MSETYCRRHRPPDAVCKSLYEITDDPEKCILCKLQAIQKVQ